jgi:alkanesulfonate monooxygenase SsuD/methylene tetrahydromethanopterin reductase-like flavin-dependent oxidoreductase (luciferase family)
MHLGMTVTSASSAEELSAILARAVGMEGDGWTSVWIPSGAGPDVMLLMSLIGASTSSVDLGSFVVPATSRHPVTLAAEALTIAAHAGRPITLGVGLGHPERSAYTKLPAGVAPITFMREFLELLRLSMRGGSVRYSGKAFEVNTKIDMESAACSVLLAAAQPHMLDLAADLTDGLVTWLFGLSYLEAAVNSISERRDSAFRVAAGLPLVITTKADAANDALMNLIDRYGRLRNHHAILEAQRDCRPGDLALIGDEASVLRRIQQMESAGATEVVGALLPVPSDPDSAARTYRFVTDYANSSRGGAITEREPCEEPPWE